MDGQCCICGEEGKLSFEHVPPRAAYNDQRIFETNIQAMLNAEEEGRKKYGKWVQKGAGQYMTSATREAFFTAPPLCSVAIALAASGARMLSAA